MPLEERSKMSIREFFVLLWVNFTVFCRNTLEFFKIACRYYGSLTFLKADVALRLMYLFHNPFTISKRFLLKKGEKDVYTYGETPLTTLEAIARQAEIVPSDCVFELGSGRGRACFWLSIFIGCRVVGLEYVPEFVERANRIKNKLKLQNVEFRCTDFFKTDYSEATVCYLYGTCLDDDSIKKMIAKFSKLKPGTKIITVSYPLSDYVEKPLFEIVKHFTASYTWGEADVYIQVVR